MALHTNGTIGGLLNATFGNAPELLLSVAALRSGYYRVVQLAMLGSILCNLLFVFGVACLLGGLRWHVLKLRHISGAANIVLLYVAVAGCLFPAALRLSGQYATERAASPRISPQEVTFCRVNAAVLFCLYLCFLVFQLGTHREEFSDEHEHGGGGRRKKPRARRNQCCHAIVRYLMRSSPSKQQSHSQHTSTTNACAKRKTSSILNGRGNGNDNNNADDKEMIPFLNASSPSFDDHEGTAGDDDADSESDAMNSFAGGSSLDSNNNNAPVSPGGSPFQPRRRRRRGGGGGGGVHKTTKQPHRAPAAVVHVKKHTPSPADHVTIPMLGVLPLSNSFHNKAKTSDRSENWPDVDGGDDDMESNATGEHLLGLNESVTGLFHNADDEDGAAAGDEHDEAPLLSLRMGLCWLLILTLCISSMSDILVDSIDDFALSMRLSEVFTSMVIIPFFSNVAEQVSAFIFAWRNEMDLCVAVTIGSAVQIATFVLPGSVLIGMTLDRSMTLYFGAYETVCVFFAVLVVGAILQAGSCNWFTGVMLVGIYIIFASGIWFHELENLTVDEETTMASSGESL